MLRRLVLLIAPAVLAMALFAPRTASAAQPEARTRFGLGLGGQTLVSGLSAKLYASPGTAVQFTVGGWGRFGLALGLDGVVEVGTAYRNEGFRLVPYVGAGGTLGGRRSKYGEVSAVAASGIGGLALQLRRLPIEFAAEIRPGVIFEPDWALLHIGAGGAIRYYF